MIQDMVACEIVFHLFCSPMLKCLTIILAKHQVNSDMKFLIQRCSSRFEHQYLMDMEISRINHIWFLFREDVYSFHYIQCLLLPTRYSLYIAAKRRDLDKMIFNSDKHCIYTYMLQNIHVILKGSYAQH